MGAWGQWSGRLPLPMSLAALSSLPPRFRAGAPTACKRCSLPPVVPSRMEEPEGVLLYYKYLPLDAEAQQGLADYLQRTCTELGLKGRIRVATEGLNTCLGGKLMALAEHRRHMEGHPHVQGR